jgi:hypothetical protein
MSQKIIDRSYVGELLQKIYTSQLNLKISLGSEGGYFYLSENGRRLHFQGTTIEEVVTQLALKVAADYPSSDFAYWWKMNFRASDNDLH